MLMQQGNTWEYRFVRVKHQLKSECKVVPPQVINGL